MSKKIEDKYKKLDDISHVILRPSMYLGSIKKTISNRWVIENNLMVKKEITFIPAFIKLFDEIITNSIDESKREGSKLKTIKVNIDETNISVWDDGGIPVVKHKEHKEWIPEMIFSNMKAGSNFSDDEDRTWAGTNGVGSSCVNIFSKKFMISTSDGSNSFNQIFSNNMRDRTKPVVNKSTKKYTEISFTPDLEKFGLSNIDNDHFLMIEKRIYDLAACNPSVKIFLNGVEIKIKSFEDYIKLYKQEFFFESNKEKTWSIGISSSDDGFQQISFVNSTETYDGGTHVDYILNQIIIELREFFLKKHKVDIKPSEIKGQISLFINSTIFNPSFSSQTKEKLITEIKDFGINYEVSPKLIQTILKSEIVSSILDWIDRKKAAEENKLLRNLTKKIKVDKLIDCQSTNRNECEIFIMEGLSALGDFRKYRDPNKQAAYSLRGKFTNTNGMSNSKILLNEEAKNLILSIGLDLGNLNNMSNIRYGKIIICTDIDTDGDSICGLLINFFSKWKFLIETGKLYRAMAPLMVAKSKVKKLDNKYFYSMSEYDKWVEKNNINNYEIDYKKGLGSLETEEFKVLIQETKLIKFKDNNIEELLTWFGEDPIHRKDRLLN